MLCVSQCLGPWDGGYVQLPAIFERCVAVVNCHGRRSISKNCLGDAELEGRSEGAVPTDSSTNHRARWSHQRYPGWSINIFDALLAGTFRQFGWRSACPSSDGTNDLPKKAPRADRLLAGPVRGSAFSIGRARRCHSVHSRHILVAAHSYWNYGSTAVAATGSLSGIVSSDRARIHPAEDIPPQNGARVRAGPWQYQGRAASTQHDRPVCFSHRRIWGTIFAFHRRLVLARGLVWLSWWQFACNPRSAAPRWFAGRIFWRRHTIRHRHQLRKWSKHRGSWSRPKSHGPGALLGLSPSQVKMAKVHEQRNPQRSPPFQAFPSPKRQR